MTNKEKITLLTEAFEDTIWMAIRYAHGRHTYAPSMVRDSIKKFKKVYPQWNPREDVTIKPVKSLNTSMMEMSSDSLYDLFNNNETKTEHETS
jgi:hypothetical protein